MYKAYPYSLRHKPTFLPRLRPYPVSSTCHHAVTYPHIVNIDGLSAYQYWVLLIPYGMLTTSKLLSFHYLVLLEQDYHIKRFPYACLVTQPIATEHQLE